MAPPLLIGSFFSGIGGIELGLELAGLGHTVWQAERNPFRRAVLAKHWPNVPRFEDVDDVTPDNACAVDLICGGFPCQPFSSASRGRKVAEDAWPKMRAGVDRFRPRWVVAENVTAEPVQIAARDLATLGYTARTLELPASLVGAPHERGRWFVVAHADQKEQHRRPVHASMACVSDLSGLGWDHDIRAHRVADGLSGRMDRRAACGDAVVPAVAEVVGHMIIELAHMGW